MKISCVVKLAIKYIIPWVNVLVESGGKVVHIERNLNWFLRLLNALK